METLVGNVLVFTYFKGKVQGNDAGFNFGPEVLLLQHTVIPSVNFVLEAQRCLRRPADL